MTAYLRHQVGNKQFVVEWELDPTQLTGEIGDAFEAVDCRLITIHAFSDNGVDAELLFTNFTDNSVNFNINIPEHVMIPWVNTPTPLPPPFRYYWPKVAHADGVAPTKVALLFEAL